MSENKDIIALTGDLGYGGFDAIQKSYPGRFFNVGAAEQCMVDMAVGMALAGRIPFCYTITPFYYRAFETLRTYVDHEKIPVKLVGSGRDSDYKEDGYSHYAGDDGKLIGRFDNIDLYWPEDENHLDEILKTIVTDDRPVYLNLKR